MSYLDGFLINENMKVLSIFSSIIISFGICLFSPSDIPQQPEPKMPPKGVKYFFDLPCPCEFKNGRFIVKPCDRVTDAYEYISMRHDYFTIGACKGKIQGNKVRTFAGCPIAPASRISNGMEINYWFEGVVTPQGEIKGTYFSGHSSQFVKQSLTFRKACPHNNEGCLYMAGSNCNDPGGTKIIIQSKDNGKTMSYTGMVCPGSVLHDDYCLTHPRGYKCYDHDKNDAEGKKLFDRAIADVVAGRFFWMTKTYDKTQERCDVPNSTSWKAPSGTRVRDKEDAWFCKSGEVVCSKVKIPGRVGGGVADNCKCK